MYWILYIIVTGINNTSTWIQIKRLSPSQ